MLTIGSPVATSIAAAQSGAETTASGDATSKANAAKTGAELTASNALGVVTTNIYSPSTTTINGGKITTGSLYANQITTGTGNERIEINNDSIRVYNGGVLRVKIGNLS